MWWRNRHFLWLGRCLLRGRQMQSELKDSVCFCFKCKCSQTSTASKSRKRCDCVHAGWRSAAFIGHGRSQVQQFGSWCMSCQWIGSSWECRPLWLALFAVFFFSKWGIQMGFLITKLISANVMNHSVNVQRTGLVGPQLEIGWRSLTRQAGRDGGRGLLIAFKMVWELTSLRSLDNQWNQQY